jgi:pilus assembly protein Flp/PilA
MSFVRIARLTATWVTARLNLKSERGATAVEYGIMVALIAAVIIAAVWLIGRETSESFSCVGEALAKKTASPGAC